MNISRLVVIWPVILEIAGNEAPVEHFRPGFEHVYLALVVRMGMAPIRLFQSTSYRGARLKTLGKSLLYADSAFFKVDRPSPSVSLISLRFECARPDVAALWSLKIADCTVVTDNRGRTAVSNNLDRVFPHQHH